MQIKTIEKKLEIQYKSSFTTTGDMKSVGDESMQVESPSRESPLHLSHP
jgi:hypothetical protein